MAKKKQEEAPKGSPAWMATFSDLMNLLLCFFVLLFSMSSIDAAKYEQVVASFNQTFSVLNGGATAIGDGILISNGVSQLNELDDYINSTGKMDEGQIVDDDLANVQEKMEEAKMEESEQMAEKIQEAVDEKELGGEIDIDFTSQYVQLTLKGALLFDSGRAVLKDEAKQVLNKIGDILLGYSDNLIEVIGHTDNVPISTSQFRDNMDLSYYRARAVMDYLIDQKNIPRGSIQTSGRGEDCPIASNETAEGRALNRRVEIRIYRELE